MSREANTHLQWTDPQPLIGLPWVPQNLLTITLLDPGWNLTFCYESDMDCSNCLPRDLNPVPPGHWHNVLTKRSQLLRFALALRTQRYKFHQDSSSIEEVMTQKRVRLIRNKGSRIWNLKTLIS